MRRASACADRASATVSCWRSASAVRSASSARPETRAAASAAGAHVDGLRVGTGQVCAQGPVPGLGVLRVDDRAREALRGGALLDLPHAQETGERDPLLMIPLEGGDEAVQPRPGLLDRARLVERLGEEGRDGALVCDRRVDAGIGTGVVGADVDEVVRPASGREHGAEGGRLCTALRTRDLAGHAGHGPEDVDRGVVAGEGERAIQHDVAVEDGADRVGDGLVVIVAVDEHGVDAGDGPGAVGAGALQQPGEEGEGGRRVAAGGRRLTRGEPDLALGHRDPGQRVHHEDRVGALVTEGFRDPGGGERGTDAGHGRLVRGRDDDDGAGESLRPQIVLDELRTSRPRSPTRAITVTSASVPRAIIDSSDDFPTPDPANRPTRCPRPTLTRVSRARTPRGSAVSMRSRSMIEGCRDPGSRAAPRADPSVDGASSPSRTRPSSADPVGTRTGPPRPRTGAPTVSPATEASGMQRSPSSPVATTSASMPSSVTTSPRRRRARGPAR